MILVKKTAVLQTVGILLLVVLINSCCAKKKKESGLSSNLLKVCPEEWIQNKMPGPDTQQQNEYFILEGKRRELKEFDLEWIKKNCDIKPQIVY